MNELLKALANLPPVKKKIHTVTIQGKTIEVSLEKKLEISNKKIEVVARDNSGNATIYRTKITTTFSLEHEGKIFKQKKFSSNFSYNNILNSFELSQYQKTIEENLINKIAEEIIIFINI